MGVWKAREVPAATDADLGVWCTAGVAGCAAEVTSRCGEGVKVRDLSLSHGHLAPRRRAGEEEAAAVRKVQPGGRGRQKSKL